MESTINNLQNVSDKKEAGFKMGQELFSYYTYNELKEFSKQLFEGFNERKNIDDYDKEEISKINELWDD